MPDFPKNEIFESIGFTSIIFALFILFLSVFTAKFIESLKSKIQSKFPEYRLQAEQGITVTRFFILLIGIGLSIFAVFSFSKEVMLAIGGSLAVAIGFGLKDVAASILSGFLILFERPFQVGDRISFENTYGDVISIGLRATKIRTLDDSTITIPNNQFITEYVSSCNSGELNMMTQIDFYIAVESDLEKIKPLIRQCIVSSRYVFLKKPFIVLFSEVFQNNILCTQIRIKAYIIETRHEKPFLSDITLRMREILNESNIHRPSLFSQPKSNLKDVL